MKTDVNGCSTTAAGQEQYEEFYSKLAGAMRVQYDYRTPSGHLFSCVAPSLGQARIRRDAWLRQYENEAEAMPCSECGATTEHYLICSKSPN